MNKKHDRVETGSLQFGDDWPCVVIRGDNAMYYAMILNNFLSNAETAKDDVLSTIILNGLADILGGCAVSPDGNSSDCQYVKDFNEVVVDNKQGTSPAETV